MKCPIDNVDLVMSDRQGIEIDYCPTCRGVWLDRGELDKIIERSGSQMTPQQPQRPAQPQYRDEPRYDNRDRDDYKYKSKKKESFLGEIFDF